MATNSALELGAAQALFSARMMVAALHDIGPWEMQWGSMRVPATREINDAGVTFRGTFPNVCWLTPPDEGVVILLDGEFMGMRRIDSPGDTSFTVTWSLATQIPEFV